MHLSTVFKTILFTLAMALAACEKPASQKAESPIREGTTAYVKMGGQHYKAEATHAHDGIIAWTYFWKKQPVWKYKSYRGLMTIYSQENEFQFWNKFDQKAIDDFFPLETGRELTLEGMTHSKKDGVQFPFWAHISVREKDVLKIKDREYPVYILDYSFIEERPEGSKTFHKTLWYSEDMELGLKSEWVHQDKTFVMRVVSMNEPEEYDQGEEYEPEGLGTVRL